MSEDAESVGEKSGGGEKSGAEGEKSGWADLISDLHNNPRAPDVPWF